MIENAFIIAMIVLFLHACTWDGAIFQIIRKWIDEKSAISKPIYSCPICMTPWWGTLIYLIFFTYTGTMRWFYWKDFIPTIFAASGISVLSVIAIYIKDYCKSRTRAKGCLGCEGTEETNIITEKQQPHKIAESDVESW